MSRESVLDTLQEDRFVVIMRGVPLDKLPQTVKTLVQCGIRLAEVTFDQCAADPTADYAAAVHCIRKTVGEDLILGAGTVMTPEQLDAACRHGAEFIVSPNTDPAIISETRRRGLVSIPGALTPSEIALAWRSGADVVKFFPAYAMGLQYIRNVREAISQVELLGTGGCNEETIPDYWDAGVHYFGTGLITSRRLVSADNYREMARLARAHMAAIRACKQKP